MNVSIFVSLANKNLEGFYKKNPTSQKFSIDVGVVSERIMRLGIEAKVLNVKTEDELREVAIATLKNDFVRHSHDSKK